MEFTLLVIAARWTVLLAIGGLTVTVAIKLLTGEINTSYLLYGTRRDGTKYFSPERVQLLVMTIATAIQYLTNAAQNTSGTMPAPSRGMLELLGTSNVLYLGGKGWAAFKGRS